MNREYESLPNVIVDYGCRKLNQDAKIYLLVYFIEEEHLTQKEIQAFFDNYKEQVCKYLCDPDKYNLKLLRKIKCKVDYVDSEVCLLFDQYEPELAFNSDGMIFIVGLIQFENNGEKYFVLNSHSRPYFVSKDIALTFSNSKKQYDSVN